MSSSESSTSESDGIYSDEEFSDQASQSDNSEVENNQPNRRQSDDLRGCNADDEGPVTPLPDFRPSQVPGVQLPEEILTRQGANKYLTPFSIFSLYFSLDIVQHLCNWTNEYAHIHGPSKPTLYNGWTPMEPDDMYSYFALLMYMAIIKVPSVELYWSTEPLCEGLWAPHFMSKLRFKAIQAFVTSCNATTKNGARDKLSKIRLLHDYIRCKCKNLYQPYQNLSIDERMVHNRGRLTFRKFIKDKPTHWGMKLWILADASNGYTYDFEVYTGKGIPISKNGLAYDVVMRLCRSLERQGYHVYFDNFYTGVQLVKDLLTKKILCCGTLQTNRKGVPAAFKDTKAFATGQRGSLRWKREGDLLFLQWMDSKPVTFLSSIHKKATGYGHVQRKMKVTGQCRPVHVRQPIIVKDYNTNKRGVDRSDQMIGKYETFRKTNHWWKTLLFHFLDVALVNSYLLFKDLQKKFPHQVEYSRPARYNQLDFTHELIMEMGKVPEDADVPVFQPRTPAPSPPDLDHPLQPDHADKARNCVLCYRRHKVERKTLVMCRSCGKHYCFTSKRNCLVEAHKLD